ncbi:MULTISPECIES: SRPBCC domain-containing protein [Streptomyces]|uniref:SRPBCC domain-containing protein n=1 Tax=Streptomyces xanthii TaxID=2768069 RepID=A0A7H1BBF3_9ACTN|nr:SRPBCC domain-containing protein [Streptomyces xanthii]QNS06058.1 SRPBCC domain-containing protein [Streptomyces xanthii]
MRRISTEVVIDASPGDVWSVLTDFERFPEWNPFIVKAAGRVAVGEQLDLTFRQASGRHMGIKPTVVAAEPGRVLRWRGRLWLPGIFDGEHIFELSERPEGGTLLVQSETFAGLLVPFTQKVVRETVGRFIDLNEALRTRVESGAGKTA